MALDFLIVGGGIGGAVLATLLGQRGKRVLVLERSRTPPPQNRPEILWPATVERLRPLLAGEADDRWLFPLRTGVVMCGQRRLLEFGPDVFQRSGVQPYSTANTRELLLKHAPCECRRGQEVVEVLRDGARVVGVRARDTASGAEQELLAEWTVGDDGAHSVIRQACGLRMRIVAFPLEVLGFSFDWPSRLPAGVAHFWINEQRLRTGVLGMPTAPMPGGRGVALLPIWPEVLACEDQVRRALRGFAQQHPALEELLGARSYPEGFTRFRLAWSRTPQFGAPGALLLGDAAHPVTPAGGQGANAAVADAFVIAEAALERPSTLLAEYQRRRRPAVRRSLALSAGVARALSFPRALIELGLAAAPWVLRRAPLPPRQFDRFLRLAANAFREEGG